LAASSVSIAPWPSTVPHSSTQGAFGGEKKWAEKPVFLFARDCRTTNRKIEENAVLVTEVKREAVKKQIAMTLEMALDVASPSENRENIRSCERNKLAGCDLPPVIRYAVE
jgi:hypothetical protein